jgi:glycosyltransferase involved in cell wall biosynthesis
VRKRKLLVWLSAPVLGQTRRRIEGLRRQVLHSRGARLCQALILQQPTEAAPASAEALTLSELAYRLPTLPMLRRDPAILLASQRARQELGLPLFASLYWLESISLQIRTPLPHRRVAFSLWWQTQGPPHYRDADRLLEQVGSADADPLRFCDRPFGVNLVGHVFNVFGLGEYARMMARALEAAAIPFCVRDIPVGNGSSDQDRSLEAHVRGEDQPLPFAFTLFCMTAESQLHLALTRGPAPSPRSYTISCWFWETERWPERLRGTLELADEFWPCTRLIETALCGALGHPPQPVVRIPPVVDISAALGGGPHPCSREVTRASFGLDRKAVLFAFSFDLNSKIARKNPQAVLQAFQIAFGNCGAAAGEDSVGLVIKAFPPRSPEPLWDHLKATAAADPRIIIIEADLDRGAILALYGCCDAFVSLHRSEGLGLGPAEALQLGLDVIATDYGGNTDFCVGPLAHPIPYRLIPVQSGEYPHHEGMEWAEPDVEQAAQRMRQVAAQRQRDPHPDPAVVRTYRQSFSASHIGKLYRERLEALWARRVDIQAQLEQRSGLSDPCQCPSMPRQTTRKAQHRE